MQKSIFSPSLLFAAIAVLFSISCSSLSEKDIPSESELIALEPQKIEIGFDVFLLRIDLNRQHTTQTRQITKTDAQGKSYTTTETVTVDVPYHYIGVEMGNGLFLDANSNLSLDLVRLAGLKSNQNYEVQKKSNSFLGSDTVYRKSGQNLTIDYGGLFSSPTEITLKENGAVFKGGVLSSDQEIIVEKDRITYDPHGLFDGWGKSYILKVGSSAQIPGFWQDTTINKNKDGSINLGKALMLRHEGKRILFTYSGFFGSERVYSLVRTPQKLVYYDERRNGVMIEIFDGLLRVTSHGHTTEYVITSI